MIRVLHYGLSTNRGGIETYLDKVWTHIDHTLFCFDFVDEWRGQAFFREKFEKMGSAFYDITPRRESVVKNCNEWNKILQEEKPDILHCHLNTLSYITPVEQALKLGIPTIVHSRSSGVNASTLTRALHRLNKIRLQNLDIVRLAVSTEAGNWLFRGKSKYTVLNNGIDIDRFTYHEEDCERIRRELDLSPDTFVVGNVGSLTEIKNQRFLIDIFQIVHKMRPDSVLLIAGQGRQKEELEAHIAELNLANAVFLLGNRPDVPALLAAMDVFVMPSLFEGFPNAALEAQTSGLPCVLSDVITREVNVGSVTYLSLKEATVVWADVINRANCSDSRASAVQMVDNAGFSIASEIKQLENIYLNL